MSKRRKGNALVSRGELSIMHRTMKRLCRERSLGPGSVGYSLLASLGACLGNYPRVKAGKVAELRRDYRALVQQERKDVQAPQRTVADLREGKVDRAGLPCESCGLPTPADELVLFEGGFLCPGCVSYHQGAAERASVKASNVQAACEELIPF